MTSSINSLITGTMLLALWAIRRTGRPRGILLTSSRGPAEMVFLAAVLPRFMRLAEDDETVTLLMRDDAGSMAFLFPPSLRVKRVDFRRLAGSPRYRWDMFRQLRQANYRLAVSLDLFRPAEPAGALLQAAGAAETAVMVALGRDPEAWATRVFPAGPLRQDKILRWSRFADFLTGWKLPPALALMPGHRLPEAMRFEIPTVAIFPFSAVRGRQLPADTWAAILDALPAGWQVLVGAHRDDLHRNPDFDALLQRPRVQLDTSGFDLLAAKLMGARMAIGADTAGTHLSILLGAPTLCIASAAFVGAGLPYDESILPANAHFIHVPMECQGCLGHCPFPPENGMLPCVAAIRTETITTTIADMIARGGF